MGPLASLFAQLYDRERPRRVDALRAKLSAGDDMGPIFLDPEHMSSPHAEGLVPEQMLPFERRPGIKGSRPYREPMQAGPAPPVSSPFAAMLERKR